MKQLCNHKLWDFAMVFRVRKTGTFEKRAPDIVWYQVADLSKALTNHGSNKLARYARDAYQKDAISTSINKLLFQGQMAYCELLKLQCRTKTISILNNSLVSA